MDERGKKYYDEDNDYTKISYIELLKELEKNEKNKKSIFKKLQEWNVLDHGRTRAEYNPYYNRYMIVGMTINSIQREIERRDEQNNQISEKKFNNNKKNFIIFVAILILCFLFSNYLKKENI